MVEPLTGTFFAGIQYWSPSSWRAATIASPAVNVDMVPIDIRVDGRSGDLLFGLLYSISCELSLLFYHVNVRILLG